MIYGRRLKPLGAALAFACLSLFGLNATNVGVLGDNALGDVVGAFGVAAALLLTVGWWTSASRVYRAGLLVAFAVWAFRAYLVALQPVALGVPGLYLSVSWALAAGGAYLLERPTKGGRHRAPAAPG